MRIGKWYQINKHFIRHLSNEKPSFKEIKIPVPWGQIRGKWWGRTDIRPILSVHGWQDNCGTFDRLIPLLTREVGHLTIDFPGHGYSSRLHPGIYYHFTTYLMTIRHITKYLGWPKVSLMGHSMGGVSSYLYTMLYPLTTDFLVCIDGTKPLVNPKSIQSLAKSISTSVKFNEYISSDKEPPSYTLEEIKQKVHEAHNGSIAIEHASCLIKRNVAPSKLHPGKYYFTRDPRLKAGAAWTWMFTQQELVKNAHLITCPIFISKASKASYYEDKNNFYEVLEVLKESSTDCDFHYVEGTHHVHLNDPEELAGYLNKFIERHNTEDRSVGGIKEGMEVLEEEDLRI